MRRIDIDVQLFLIHDLGRDGAVPFASVGKETHVDFLSRGHLRTGDVSLHDLSKSSLLNKALQSWREIARPVGGCAAHIVSESLPGARSTMHGGSFDHTHSVELRVDRVTAASFRCGLPSEGLLLRYGVIALILPHHVTVYHLGYELLLWSIATAFSILADYNRLRVDRFVRLVDKVVLVSVQVLAGHGVRLLGCGGEVVGDIGRSSNMSLVPVVLRIGCEPSIVLSDFFLNLFLN